MKSACLLQSEVALMVGRFEAGDVNRNVAARDSLCTHCSTKLGQRLITPALTSANGIPAGKAEEGANGGPEAGPGRVRRQSGGCSTVEEDT